MKTYYDEKYKKIYKDEARIYNKTRFGKTTQRITTRLKNDVILDILKTKGLIRKNTKIIDLATGTGRIAHELVKRKFSHVYSADITPEMLRKSKEKLDPKYHRKLSWILADIKEIPFPDNYFDVVTLGSFFYLIPQQQYNNYTKDIWRILKPGGIFICEVSNSLTALNPWNLIQISYHKHWKKLKVKSYINPWDIHKIFKHFELEEIIGVEYPVLIPEYRIYRNYSHFLGHFPVTKYLGGKYVLVLKKTSNDQPEENN